MSYELQILALTKKSRAAFDRICINDDTALHPQTIKALLKAGLIEEYIQEERIGNMVCRIKHYRTPIPVHMIWAEICDKEISDDDLIIRSE